jgi:short-subunit dehydrogenase
MALPPPAPDSVALVTGASGGIGEELARGLARRGRNVVLVARREDVLERLAEEVRAAHSVRAEVVACDLGDAASRDRLAARVDELGLTVEILVNNAGFGTYEPFSEADREREVEMVRVNVESVVDLTARYLPGMVERGRGAILTTASTAAYQPIPRNATYAASKAFVLSHVLAVREEVKRHGVTVTALCPGPVRTPFQETAGVDPSFVPGPVWVSAETVAEAGLVGLEKGRREVVPGAVNRVTALASQVTPNAVLLPILGRAAQRLLGH